MFECPVVGGTCIGIPFNVSGNGVSTASASPNPVDYGNVPINTTATSTVTITVDAGYRTEVASGSGLNAPFAFDFGTCGTGGGFTGPGTCTVSERYTPTAVGPNSGTTNVFECPVVGRDLYRHSVQRERQRCEHGVGESESGQLTATSRSTRLRRRR